MFRSLVFVMLSVIAVGSSAWAQPRARETTRKGQPQLQLPDSYRQKRAPPQSDPRDRAPVFRAESQPWFWREPNWQLLTW